MREIGRVHGIHLMKITMKSIYEDECECSLKKIRLVSSMCRPNEVERSIEPRAYDVFSCASILAPPCRTYVWNRIFFSREFTLRET